jgi:superfamily I DNA/RNA helicase
MIRAEHWEPVDGLDLEPNALAAVCEQEAHVVVTAGPGAGKTELLAQRADFLLRTGTSPYPKRILAISFKVDAARNLRARVRQRSGPQYAARFDSFTFHAFAKRLIDNYRLSLTGDDALVPDYKIDDEEHIPGEQITYSDLVPLALKILRSNKYARNALRQTYSHVFMDEFQDATGPQYDFLREAFGRSNALLTGVGDTKQRIMVFAGALDGVMASFETDFKAKHYRLYQNFRSKPKLRRMQNRMILDMDPLAAVPKEELQGDAGSVRVFPFETERDEATGLSDLISEWLSKGTSPREIAVLVRQQPHLVAKPLGDELISRGIPYRNEQKSQDLATEPVAALIFNFLSVVADDGQPDAYSELFRVITQGNREEPDDIWGSQLNMLLAENRRNVRAPEFDQSSADEWKPLVSEFLRFVTIPALNALSPAYQQGSRLREVVGQAFKAFSAELEVDGNPRMALERLSEVNAIRFLTIHKCKGLEFEKVIVLGVERELFWNRNSEENMSEFFVAISRAKDEIILTHASQRTKPAGARSNWRVTRNVHSELLSYAFEPRPKNTNPQ